LTRTGWKGGGLGDGELSDDDEEEESGDEGDSEEQEEEKEPFREGLESWG
jgi:hypothetical protein